METEMVIDYVSLADPSDPATEGFALGQTCLLRCSAKGVEGAYYQSQTYYLAQIVERPTRATRAVRLGVVVLGQFRFDPNGGTFGVYHCPSPLRGEVPVDGALQLDRPDVREIIRVILQGRAPSQPDAALRPVVAEGAPLPPAPRRRRRRSRGRRSKACSTL